MRPRIAILAGLLLGTLEASNAQILLDSYDAGPFTITGDNATLVSADSSQIIGGTREVTISSESNPFLPHSTLSLKSGEGYVEYDRQQNSWLWISYGSYAMPQFAFNVDLTANGADRFRLNVLAAPGPFRLGFTAQDNSFYGNIAQTTLLGNGPGVYEIPFSSFGPVEFDKLRGLEYWFTSFESAPYNGPGVYRFESLMVVPVPEPRNYAIGFSLGLLAFAALRRARAAKARDFKSPRPSL
jgi:hypothetical protein